ncbi:hypothetical protein [Lignipirellula cremea]|uniref:Uncharacterized protein n=1 Tax=Lignipirellula cremea TaxID=2528010 RepID=A0A518DWV2_9BACT|nr:hypothetical protein [Lignipirellula cremea]QDU96316.1 hypothetical protein Pla8534_41360 [Lignipirellula cremea]
MRLHGVLCESVCYGSSDDGVCRITPQKSKPKRRDLTDGYSPSNDDSLLWIRSCPPLIAITGYARKSLFPHSDQLDDFLDRLQDLLPTDAVQPKVTIEVIGKTRNWLHCFNGEQMDTRY